ncbi:class I SAM-dependent methyltransferase [Micromonospora sp. NPDC048170]|uniref:class I SAM-dependent methyltransferase n=1 Tax=Micromonospora sp. NPDC048170 TaxID=3154819 RepID=UPI0033C08CDF
MHDHVPEYILPLEGAPETHERIPCPICGSTERAPLYEGVALRGNTLILDICLSCSHLYINPRPSMAAFNEFYQDDAYFHLCADFSKVTLEEKLAQFDDPEFWDERFGHGKRLYDTYLTGKLTADDTVFDFGCGDGAWLWALQQLTGCAVDGEEISDIYTQIAAKRLGTSIFAGAVEEVADQIVEKHRDNVKVAIVSGSLQHMLDPMKCLRAARDILTDDGLLYICNWSIFEHYMAAYKDQRRRLLGEILSWEHLHYFHETSFKYMVRAAGFEIVEFAIESDVRERHMEIVARKTDKPAELPSRQEVEGVVMRARAFESATIAQRLRPN